MPEKESQARELAKLDESRWQEAFQKCGTVPHLFDCKRQLAVCRPAANQKHGLRRSNADKAKAVKAALRHPAGAKLSNEQIAEHCGVAPTTVAKYRGELEATLQIGESQTRTGKDGRTINTANIGKSGSKGGVT